MTDASAPVRFGILGAGIIGREHATLLSASPDTELVAVADTVADAAHALASDHAAKSYGSVDELCADDRVDAVIIALPSGLHADVTITALDAGKHVLLEKPIDVTVDAADRILAADARSSGLLTVASQRRFVAENQFVHDAIRRGALGRITSAIVDVPLWRSQEYYDSAGWRGTWRLDGGGALMNQGVHLVDLILWHLGDVEEVHAFSGRLAHERIEVEDTITINARFTSGALMTFLATTAAYPSFPIRYGVFGDGGTVMVENDRLAGYDTVDGIVPPEFPATRPDRRLLQQIDFVSAIRDGRQPLVTAGEARAAVAFICAAYESGRTGKPVTLA